MGKKLKQFRFTSSWIIEGEDDDDAKNKFANESWDFAADADCVETDDEWEWKERRLKTAAPDLLKACQAVLAFDAADPQDAEKKSRLLRKAIKLSKGVVAITLA